MKMCDDHFSIFPRLCCTRWKYAFSENKKHSKGLVGSVPAEDPLFLRIARGTGVLERHESAVVDLCQSTGVSDKEVEDCVVQFLKDGYDTVTGPLGEERYGDDELAMECYSDIDAECMLDGMMNLWADDLPLPSTTSGAKKAKPWSSRSSPSGTFVRDPVTGEMRNIDA
jgi:hypothetical protein